jgi:hypothetical protein
MGRLVRCSVGGLPLGIESAVGVGQVLRLRVFGVCDKRRPALTKPNVDVPQEARDTRRHCYRLALALVSACSWRLRPAWRPAPNRRPPGYPVAPCRECAQKWSPICHATFSSSWRLTCMHQLFETRIELLRAAAANGERALTRQRIAIEALRSEGHRTAEAERSFAKYDASYRALLEKLATLRREEG